MPERIIKILLDQNIPQQAATWLVSVRPEWEVHHVNELGFQGRPDGFLYEWAQKSGHVIVTYDEDFADSRLRALGNHAGVVRLRVWPTTIESTTHALSMLMANVPEDDLAGSLVIIDNNKIRIRKRRP